MQIISKEPEKHSTIVQFKKFGDLDSQHVIYHIGACFRLFVVEFNNKAYTSDTSKTLVLVYLLGQRNRPPDIPPSPYKLPDVFSHSALNKPAARCGFQELSSGKSRAFQTQRSETWHPSPISLKKSIAPFFFRGKRRPHQLHSRRNPANPKPNFKPLKNKK